VRLVGENIEVGIYSIKEAIAIADEQELDLVEISPKADPIQMIMITNLKENMLRSF